MTRRPQLPKPTLAGELPVDPYTSYVYLAYADEEILYVGVTDDITTRIATHQRNLAPWYPKATRIAWQQYPDRASAERVESEYIRQLDPPYNTRGRVKRPIKPVTFLVEAWVRLGELVRDRRMAMHRSQRSIADDAVVPVKLLRDVERGVAAEYPEEALVGIERVLRWRAGSVVTVLEGGEPGLLTAAEVRALTLAAYDEVAL